MRGFFVVFFLVTALLNRTKDLIMKKIFLSAIAITLLAVACKKDNLVENNTNCDKKCMQKQSVFCFWRVSP